MLHTMIARAVVIEDRLDGSRASAETRGESAGWPLPRWLRALFG